MIRRCLVCSICTIFAFASLSALAELQMQDIIIEATQQGDGPAISVPAPETQKMDGNNASEEAGEDLLTFLNSDKLHGMLMSVSATKGLRWQRNDMPAPLDFSLAGVAKVKLSPREQNKRPAIKAWVRLSNSDVLSGNIVSLDEQHLVFDTWYAGKLSIKRSMIATLRPNAHGAFTIYEGPNDLSDWNAATHGRGKTWELRNGALYALQTYPIGRNIAKLPDIASIQFKAAWRGYPQFYFSFYTDTLNSYYGNCYLLSVSTSSVYLQRYSRNGSQNSLGSVNISAFQNNGTKSAHFNLLVNKKKKTFALLINGKLVKEWTDTNAFVGGGKGILFQPQSSGNLKISEIKVSEWDGKVPQTDSTHKTGNEDMAVFSNNDKVSGQLLSIEDGVARFKTSYATLPVPMERIKEVTFAEETRERARRNKLDIRCHFTDEGLITFELSSLENGKLKGISENFGSISSPLNAFSELEFNIYTEREENDEDDF